MKRIACLGSVLHQQDENASENILELYNSLRVCNAAHSIVGVFVAFRNLVLQVLEGEPQDIAISLYKMRQTKLFKELVIVNDMTIDAPVFTTWRAKFYHPDMANHREFLQKLRKDCLPESSVQEGRPKELAEQFWAAALISGTAATPEKQVSHDTFGKHMFHITAWPKQSRVALTPRLIKLCTVLSNGWITYQQLMATGLFKSEDELDAVLKQLLRLDVLLIKDAGLTHEAVAAGLEAGREAEQEDRFGSVMRKFLSMKWKERSGQ